MKPEIRVFQTLEKLSHNAAELYVESALQAVAERGRFLVALNGGGTPKRLFELLGSEYRDKIDWNKVHVFWGDERLVPANDVESSYGQAQKLFLQHVPIPVSNIHPVDGELEPGTSARQYADILKQFASVPLEWPRFDLVYLGIGEDGHTASLFPHSSLAMNESVLPVVAQYHNRPAHRVTLTPQVLNSAHRIVFMVTGEKKAMILAEILSDRFNPELYPAQRIEPKNGKIVWLVDEDAASKLPHRLISTFCEG